MTERQYVPIPVHIPRQIGEACNKDQVVVLAHDAQHAMMHTATWGLSAEDKIAAARWGDLLTSYSGADMDLRSTFEDFRTEDAAARNAQRADDASRRLRKLEEENQALRETNNLILSGLRWTGDGYEWTGAEFDYRIKPEEALAIMQQQRESMRSIIADLVEFDRSYPKGQVYSAHEKEPERALDAIIDRAKSMLAR